MPNKKECNCCMKRSYNVSKCFVNNTCNWKSCAACIVKQIKMEDILTCKYDCPNCRQPASIVSIHVLLNGRIKTEVL